MALLRQKGSPTLFLTMSCAEYSWKELLKEVVEHVERRQVTQEYVDSLSKQQKNKMISENVVLTTLHFQKRIEKELTLMTKSNFFGEEFDLHVKSYYYRVEFQQRGSAHIHCLLWLEDSDGNEAPTFWTAKDEDKEFENEKSDLKSKIKKIEIIADRLIKVSKRKAVCMKHINNKEKDIEHECDMCYSPSSNFEKCQNHISKTINNKDCEECIEVKKLVESFQFHRHTFTCQKKKKFVNIKATEGHGRFDGVKKGEVILNFPECRFNFPQVPLNKTTFVFGFAKNLPPKEKAKRKSDLRKIKKYLIRQTYRKDSEESQSYKNFEKLNFLEFLHEVGMFERDDDLCNYTEMEKKNAYDRYINALSASIRGTGCIFLERTTEDIYTNNFNLSILILHQANIDVQIVIDQVKIHVLYNIIIK